MLCRNTCSREYIDACRRLIGAQVAARRSLVTAAAHLRGSSLTRLESALHAFDPVFFNDLVLCTSMTGNGGRMAADKSSRLDPAISIPRYRVGDEIAGLHEGFELLAAACFADLERETL